MRGLAIVVLSASMLLGCSQRSAKLPSGGIESSVGEQVTLVGVAEPRKGGAALRGDGFYVWLEGIESWPESVVMKRVEVKGRLQVDHGLPVFIQNTNDPLPVQGVPVAEGTDLREASRRFVLLHPKWKRLQ
jgi:hypothetical protein